MYIKLVTDADKIPLSKDEWNQLVYKNETNTVFQTYEWFESWWKIFGSNYRLYILFVYKNENIIGFAPFMISMKKRRNELLFIGDGNADYMDFIFPTEKDLALKTVCDFLFTTNNNWDKISLHNVPEHSSSMTLIEQACRACNLGHIITDNINCPTLLINGHYESTKKLLNKYSNKRPYNYFSRQGNLTFRHLQGVEIESNLGQFFRQHISRWGKTRHKSLFTNTQNQEFYRELAKNISPTGWLLFSIAELDGKPISYHFGFEYDNKIIWYKPSFDIKYSAHSPGAVLLRYLIQYALNTNKTELDFTIGDEAFKSRFTNAVRKNRNAEIFRRSSHFGIYKLRKIITLATKQLLSHIKNRYLS